MPNQNECDHLIGLYPGSDEQILQVLFLVYSSNVEKELTVKQFNYCPFCGAKIDWNKIKEKLDDK